MLRSLNEVIGYQIKATDGMIGDVDEFYFDDQMWKIRYLVVNTGSWLSDRLVLVSPVALDKPNWKYRILPVQLTRAQVENSPKVDLDKLVSRQQETKLRNYYQWPVYWGGLGSPVSPASTGIKPDNLGLDELGPMPQKDPSSFG